MLIYPIFFKKIIFFYIFVVKKNIINLFFINYVYSYIIIFLCSILFKIL